MEKSSEFLDQLRAWNRTWINGSNSSEKNGKATTDDTGTGTGAGTGTGVDSATKYGIAATEKYQTEHHHRDHDRRDHDHHQQQHQQHQQHQHQHQHQHPEETIQLTALEKARLSLSKLPTESLSSNESIGDIHKERIVRDSIVPCLFSVLQTKDANENENNNNNGNGNGNGNATADSIDGKDTAPPSSPVLSSKRKHTGSNQGVATSESDSESELRQMEWHVVLVLELWATSVAMSTSTSSSTNENTTGQTTSSSPWSKSTVLDALVASIGLHREAQSQRRDNSSKAKKTKKTKKRKDKKTKKKKNRTEPKGLSVPEIMSEKEKEALVLDHLVRLLSRAPFLLPRNVPLSEFFINRCFTRERRFWERLPFVVSHIFETFEIPNPYRSESEGDDDSTTTGTLFLSSDDAAATDRSAKKSGVSSVPGGTKKAKTAVDEAALARKRKLARAKLQELEKTKKRQRLASLALSKKKHRGSHFHRNLDDISKLLDKKKNVATASAHRKHGPVDAKNDALAKLKNRKTLDRKTPTTRNVNRHSSEQLNKNRHNSTLTAGDSNQRHNGDATRAKKESNLSKDKNGGMRPSVNQTVRILKNENSRNKISNKIDSNDSNNESITRDVIKNRSSNTSNADSLPMIPRRSLDFDTDSVVGETPVPNSPGIQLTENTVGETPVSGARSRTEVGETPVLSARFRSVVGETPPPSGSDPGDSPVSSSSGRNFLSPPPLPSPTFLATSSTKDAAVPSKQPVRLFGLLKRSSSINSTGAKPPSGATKTDEGNGARDLASIDKARAYLRRKTV